MSYRAACRSADCRWRRLQVLGSLLAVEIGAVLWFGAAAWGDVPAQIAGYSAPDPRYAITGAPPGTPILLLGSGLGDSGSVSFGLDPSSGVPAPAVYNWSPSQVLVTVPSAPRYPYTTHIAAVANGQEAQGPEFTITEPVAARDNLLVNGGFELPDSSGSPYSWGYTYGLIPTCGCQRAFKGCCIPGWQITRGTVDVLIKDWPPAEGNQSLDLVGSPGAATIEQSFFTEVGRKYVLSGFFSHGPAVPYGQAMVSMNGSLLAELFDDGSAPADKSRWIPFNYPFTAKSAVTSLEISDETNLSIYAGSNLDGLAVTLAP